MSTDHYWVVPGKTDAERWRDQFYEADQGRADANAEAMQLLQRGNTYRARARALRERSWRFRARWRMAEMEVRDCIKMIEDRTNRGDQLNVQLAAATARAERAIAELQEALLVLGDSKGDCGINKCDGCKYERGEAIHRVSEALRQLGGNPIDVAALAGQAETK